MKSQEQFAREFADLNQKGYVEQLLREGGMILNNPSRCDVEAMQQWGYQLLGNNKSVNECLNQIVRSQEWADKHPGEVPPTFPVGGGGGGGVGPLPVAGQDQIFGCWVSSLGTSRIENAHAAEFFYRVASEGCNGTEFWMLPWLDDDDVFKSVAPWQKTSDGRYDLNKINEEYWDMKLETIYQAHKNGLTVQLCFMDLYAWAASKQGLLWVPNRDRNPVRNNINGVRWGDPDDDWTYGYPLNPEMLPDSVLRALIEETCRRAPTTGIYFRTANESPEKPMHQRIADYIRSCRSDAFVICNRQNNNPGQYRNMVKNGGLDGIEFHGFETVDYINTVVPGDVPNNYPDAWAEAEPRRVFMSTDGCRNGNTTQVGNSYDYDSLGEVLIDHKKRGFNYSHQSDRKMCKFIEGQWSWNNWENERRMLERVAAA